MAKDWIRDRHMKTGAGINPNPRNNGSKNGPLRKVEYLIRSGPGGIFGRDLYHLECGHEVRGTKGASRVRCYLCRDEIAGTITLL